MNNVDFSECKRIIRSYGGSDRKFGIEYHGDTYMLKFSEEHAKRTEISTSHVNNVISEYISSHIVENIGLPVHKTLLGTYNDEVVVACKDFRKKGDDNVEFQDLLRAKYDSKDSRKYVKLDQVYSIYNDELVFPEELREDAIKRFWDTFVIDAFVGNFDRHTGNWGFLSNDGEMRIAPIYDLGSTLLPQLAEEGMIKYKGDTFELAKRCMVFPSPVMYITDEKVGKVGYYDMLASGYDKNCTEALMRVVPRIKMYDVYSVINNTPFISDVRKEFYANYLTLRKEIIIDKAYEICEKGNYDRDAIKRITTGKQFTDELISEHLDKCSVNCLDYKIERAKVEKEMRKNSEKTVEKCYSNEYDR